MYLSIDNTHTIALSEERPQDCVGVFIGTAECDSESKVVIYLRIIPVRSSKLAFFRIQRKKINDKHVKRGRQFQSRIISFDRFFCQLRLTDLQSVESRIQNK